MNKTNKNYKRSQRGRSMVEMLGVLAVVGVLSVGGVYGYGVAMKKHKANELLHQASMLAATISAQAMTNDGKLPETITSFGNSNYGTFSTSATDALNGKGFSITIENVDSAVCDQLKKGGMVQGVDCKEGTSEGKINAEITYYKNLATNDEEGKNSPTGKKPECSPACQEGQQCIGGVCAKVEPNSCLDYESDCSGCSQNADCDDWCATYGDGEECYCAITADFLENDSACYNNFTGLCAVAGKEDYNDGYIKSSDPMSWWGAVNFCKAHGKSLVSLSDLGLSEDCMQTQGCYDYEFIRSKVGAGFDTWLMDSLGDGFEHYNHHNFCFPLRLNYEGASGLVRYLVEDTHALCH